MSQFIGASMPAAFAGDLTRGAFDATTEAKANDGTTPVQAFGIPVKYNAGHTAVKPISAGSDAVIGFSVRVYGQANTAGAQAQNFVTVLKRGYIAVTAPADETITAGQQVYLVAATGAITAASEGNTALTGAVFCGAANGGIIEIAYNI